MKNAARLRPMRVGVGSLAVASLVLLAACGSGSNSPETEPTSQPTATDSATTPSEEGSTLTIWATDDRLTALKPITDKFTEDTGIEFVFVQKSWDDLREHFLTQVPTGQGPDIMASGGDDWPIQFADNGVVAPIELADKADDFAPGTLESFTVGGVVYGVPYATENVGLVRNVELAPDAPETWDELLEIGQQLVADGKAEYPVIVQQGEPKGDPYHMYGLQNSFGVDVFKTDGDGRYTTELALGDEGSEDFVNWLADMGEEDIFLSSVTYDIAVELFAEGKTPFIVSGPWATPSYQQAGIDLAVSPLPSVGGETPKPFLGVQGWVISSQSKNQLAANNFLVNYIASVEGQVELYKAGGRAPALAAALEDEAVASDPIISGFAKAGEHGVPSPAFGFMDTVWADWGTAQVAIINNQGDPVEIWNTMVSNLEQKIAAAGD